MVIVGVPYTEQRLLNMAEITGGTPYGATTLAGGDGSRQPSENELASRAPMSQRLRQNSKAEGADDSGGDGGYDCYNLLKTDAFMAAQMVLPGVIDSPCTAS